jgi:hypothetical protein
MVAEKKLTRYEVTSVWGKVPDKIVVGAVIRDTWHGQTYSWDIMDLPTGKYTGGWAGRAIDESAEIVTK